MTAPVTPTPTEDALRKQVQEASNQPNTTVVVVSQLPPGTNTETLIAAATYRPNSQAGAELTQRSNQNSEIVAAAIEQRLQNTGAIGNPKLLNYTPAVNVLSNAQRSINNVILPLNNRENLLRGASAKTQQLAAQFEDLRKLTELQQKLENITQRLEAQINTAGQVLKTFLNGPDAAASAAIGVLISRLEDLEAAYTKIKAVLALVKKVYENTKRAIIKALFEDIPKMLEKIQKTKKTIEKILSVPETPRKIIFPKLPRFPKLSWKKIDLYAKAKKVWETFKKKNSEFRQKAYLKAVEQSGFEIIDPKKDKVQRGLTKARNELREARARLQAAQATRNEAIDRATSQLNKNINQINRNVERERERFTKEFKKLNSNLQKRLAEIGSRKKYLTEPEIAGLVNSPTVNVLIKNLYGDLPNTVKGGSLPPQPATPAPNPGPTIPYPGKIYGRGPGDTSRNDANVQRIQEKLNQVLNLTGTNALVIDGIIGPLTEAAIKKFQQSKNINVDGRVGSATWPLLFAATPTNNTNPEAGLNIASRDDLLRSGIGQSPVGPQAVQLLSNDQANKLVDEYLYSRGISTSTRDGELNDGGRERAVIRAEALAKIQSSGLIGQRTPDGREVYKETESGALYVLQSATERLTALANKTTARLQANIQEITTAGDIVNDAIRATARVGAGFSREALRTGFQAELVKEVQTVNNLQELTRSAPSTPPQATSTNPLETTIDPKTLTITTIARRTDATRAINDAADENRNRAEQYGLKGLLTYDAKQPVAKSANGQTIFEVVVTSSYRFTTNAEITRAAANATLAATVAPVNIPPINEIVQPPVTYRPNAASVRFRQTPGTTAQNTILRSLNTSDSVVLLSTPFVNAAGLVWGKYRLVSTGEEGWIANNLITPTPELSRAINAPRTATTSTTTGTGTSTTTTTPAAAPTTRPTSPAAPASAAAAPTTRPAPPVTPAPTATSPAAAAPTTRPAAAPAAAAPVGTTAPVASATRTQITATNPSERLAQVDKRITEVNAELRKVADDIRTAIRVGQQASDPDAFNRAQTAVANLNRKENELKTEKTALELEKQKIQQNNPGVRATTTTTASPATGTTAATTTTTSTGTNTTTTSTPTTTTTRTSTSSETSTQVQQNKRELNTIRGEISKIWLQRNPIENEIELLEDLEGVNDAEFQKKGGQQRLNTLISQRDQLSRNLVGLVRSRKILESQIPNSIKYQITGISIPDANQPRTNKTIVSFKTADGLSIKTTTFDIGTLRDRQLIIDVITRDIIGGEGLNAQGPQSDFKYPGTLS